jgi:predicted RNase H-like nuclease
VVAGVVPVRKKWLVASAKMAGSTFAPQDAKLYDTFRDVVDSRPAFAAVVVGAPIGYRDHLTDPPRAADVEARKLLGRRAITIRRPPTRDTIGRGNALADDHLDAISATILPVILEIAGEMSGYRQRVVYEGSPELSFYFMNAEVPLRWSKKREEGRRERRELLESKVPGIGRVLDAKINGVREQHLLDAAALLMTSRRVQTKAAKRIPRDPEWDSEGIRMEYVF